MFRVCMIAAVLATPVFAHSPRYTIHDLGTLNGPTDRGVTGINNRGQVIGYDTRPNGQVRSFRTAPNCAINWDSDDLGTLGGTITRARGINASGEVVGESTLSSGDVRGFRTGKDQSIDPTTDNIGTLNNSDTRALAINHRGQVTGQSGGHAFVTAPNSPIDPTTDRIQVTPNELGTAGRYINNHGHVLGEFMSLTINYPTAFLYTPKSTTILNIVRAPGQDFAGLNEQDQIAFNSDRNLMLWERANKKLLGTCTTPCVPTSINNSLDIVGAARLNPFLYRNGTIYDLSALIPQGSGWTLLVSGASFSGWWINEEGQIAGTASMNNETHVVRLDPAGSVQSAIHHAQELLASFVFDSRNRKIPSQAIGTLEAALKAALTACDEDNPGATRGHLNEFESLVRSQSGRLLTKEQADQLIDLAEAAFALT